MRQATVAGGTFIPGTVLAFDIADYSKRAPREQKRAQQLCQRVLDQATQDPRITILAEHWLDVGDGGYLIMQGDIRGALYGAENFARLLAEENQDLAETARVEVRYAMDIGTVERWVDGRGTRTAGDVINDTARLLGGMNRPHRGQVVASGRYRDALVDQAGVDAALFTRLKDITDKHGGVHPVWNVRRLPGFGVEPEDDYAVFPVDDDVIYKAAVKLDNGESAFADVPMRNVERGSPGAKAIIETILVPRRAYPWTVHATFIPGIANIPLGDELFVEQDPAFALGRDSYEFNSLRDLVRTLVRLELDDASELLDLRIVSESWLESLQTDAEIFVDDAIAVHYSPLDWMQLSKMFVKGGVDTGVAAVAIYHDPQHALGILVAYGGARIFLQLITNVNRVQDAIFERIREKIHPTSIEKKASDALPPA